MGTSAYEQACEAIKSRATVPQLVVFDLDYTLWPFWCEMYSPSDEPRLYPEARAVLEALRDEDVKLAVASRTPTPRTAEVFMQKLGITDFFISRQLIPASSGFDSRSAQKDKAHFPAIQQETGLPYAKMLFFDDEPPNVQKVSRLGVTSVLVTTAEGVSVRVLQDGLQQFEDAHRRH